MFCGCNGFTVCAVGLFCFLISRTQTVSDTVV